ncbi:hypothetical protein TNCV_4654031 [Trichonephila clavipes]|nr:hypothetical protein TNCV_4654031 [Trichonephila clavipes]
MEIPLRTAYSQAGRCGMQPKAKHSLRAQAHQIEFTNPPYAHWRSENTTSLVERKSLSPNLHITLNGGAKTTSMTSALLSPKLFLFEDRSSGEIGASHLATGGQSRKHQGRQAVYRSLAATQSYDCSSLTEFEWETRRTQGARPFNRVDAKLQCCAY